MDDSVAVLDRVMYSEAEAARLLRVNQGTLHYWLEGGTYRGSVYPPVLRVEPTGVRTVTWAEFLEASLLRRYRRDLRVPLAELRDFISRLRDDFGVPYPLAHTMPWSAGQSLVIAAQSDSGLPEDLWLYAPVKDQPLLLPAGQAFLDSVTFKDDSVATFRPVDDRDSPVVVDPEVRFGKPSIRGVSTAVLWEYGDDGYTPDEIAEEFDLLRADVEWALSYELSNRAA
ncbi:MAG: DUF433 domain-containing protein [Kineosporiaceae bacterium]|nr:DUF433 domain-containing protein [Aeromicrobium sp.]